MATCRQGFLLALARGEPFIHGSVGQALPETESAGSIVAAAAGLDELRQGTTKTLRVPISSFGLGVRAATLDSPGSHGVPDRDTEIYGPLKPPPRST